MSQATSQATNQAANLVPKTVPGVLVQIGYSTHLLVPSSFIGTLTKILEQSVLVEENWTRNSGEMLVSQSGDGFGIKMKLGTFHVHTQEQYKEFRRLEDEKREAAAAEANNDVD